MSKRTSSKPAAQMSVRALTALAGGYGAAAALAALMARMLPLPRAEATAWGMTLSFLIYAVIGLWAFAEHRLVRVVVLTWGSAAAAAGLCVTLGVRP